MAPGELKDISRELVDLADRQDLIGRTKHAMIAYLRGESADKLDWAFTLEELRPELGAQMLCFRTGSMNARAPYIATNLQLLVHDYQVGWYEVLTTPGGETIREDGRILDDYFLGGRAAALIEKARRRAVTERREWIGLVELRATPGNDLFPDWATGGFVTVLALATVEEEYRQRVESFFAETGAGVEGIEDAAPLAERLRSDPSIDEETLELAVALSESLPVARASTIYSYGAEDAVDDEG